MSQLSKIKTKPPDLAYNRGMHLSTQEIVDLLLKFKYVILFPIAFFEGPTVAVIAGFMVAIKFMTFWPAYLILISANITGDIVYYLIGYWVPRKKLDRVLNFFRISNQKIKSVEKMFLKNRKKAIIFGKIAHAIGSVFLITAGIVKVPLSEYLKLGTLIEFPKAFIFLMIGFYFGKSVTNLDKVIEYSIIGFIVMTAIFVVINYYSDKYTEAQMKKT